jgi:hypothetical protein
MTISLTLTLTLTLAAHGQPSPVLLSIGVQSGDSAYEFSGVTSAVRLSNGEIVVADGRSSQLRWFDARGKFLRRVGRRGQGPNEFARFIRIYPGTADTVIVLSGRRFHFIAPDGRFARTDTLKDAASLLLYYDRTFIERNPFSSITGRMRTVAAGMPFSANEDARYAIADHAGNLWIAGSAQSGRWTGYGAAGRIIGSVSLPAAFQISQITDTLLLGVHHDSLGVERVQLHRITRSAQPAASVASTAPRRSVYDPAEERRLQPAIFAAMIRNLRNSLTAQEVHFSERQRYAPSADSLRMRTSDGVTIRVVSASDRGFWIIASHPAVRSTCMFAMGDAVPMGDAETCG